jgi:hypothetical protein
VWKWEETEWRRRQNFLFILTLTVRWYRHYWELIDLEKKNHFCASSHPVFRSNQNRMSHACSVCTKSEIVSIKIWWILESTSSLGVLPIEYLYESYNRLDVSIFQIYKSPLWISSDDLRISKYLHWIYLVSWKLSTNLRIVMKRLFDINHSRVNRIKIRIHPTIFCFQRCLDSEMKGF